MNTAEQSELSEAKKNLKDSFYRASPARIIEKYPLQSVAAFAAFGFFIGSPRRTKETVVGITSLISACTRLASICSRIIHKDDENCGDEGDSWG